ncbi:hypothetical protein Taro_054501 [Colocasia esculenta]|uniref:Uncharacterized protein n=1 Tax=Colocasia esculenta TaxID=4460 RepID=A0A843XQV2_COLES|nr:hypothetical protein [Colocasia esculenta]
MPGSPKILCFCVSVCILSRQEIGGHSVAAKLLDSPLLNISRNLEAEELEKSEEELEETPRMAGVLPGVGQPVLFLIASLFVAPEPPREATRGTVVWPDYGGYCCVLCAPASTLTRRGGETSQQRKGVCRTESVGLLSSGRAHVGRSRWGDLCYIPSGSPDPWAATAKIRSSAWAEGRVLGVVTTTPSPPPDVHPTAVEKSHLEKEGMSFTKKAQ